MNHLSPNQSVEKPSLADRVQERWMSEAFHGIINEGLTLIPYRKTNFLEKLRLGVGVEGLEQDTDRKVLERLGETGIVGAVVYRIWYDNGSGQVKKGRYLQVTSETGSFVVPATIGSSDRGDHLAEEARLLAGEISITPGGKTLV